MDNKREKFNDGKSYNGGIRRLKEDDSVMN